MGCSRRHPPALLFGRRYPADHAIAPVGSLWQGAAVHLTSALLLWQPAVATTSGLWLLLLFPLLSGCPAAPHVPGCASDDECFPGETCAQGNCVVAEGEGEGDGGPCSDTPTVTGWYVEWIDPATGGCVADDIVETNGLDLQVPVNLGLVRVGFRATASRALPGALEFDIAHNSLLSLKVNGTLVYEGSALQDITEEGYFAGTSLLVVQGEDDAGAGGVGAAHLGWISKCDRPLSAPAGGWSAKWYPMVSAAGTWDFDRTRCLGVATYASTALDPPVDYSPDRVPPELAVLQGRNDNFGGVFEANVDAPSGANRMVMDHDDGLRLFIDGDLAYDAWSAPMVCFGGPAQCPTLPTLTEGPHALRVEYFEQSGGQRLFVRPLP